MVTFPFIWGQGTENGFEDRGEYLRREARDVGMETMEMKGVESALD